MDSTVSLERLLSFFPALTDSSLSLYLHFPFCLRRCDYCAFYSRPYSEAEADAWVERVSGQVKETARRLREGAPQLPLSLQTVYIGGGTPSLLTPEQGVRLSRLLREAFTAAFGSFAPAEFSVEANPGSLTEAKAEAAARAGVTRMSLGVQSFQERLLRFIGRSGDGYPGREALAGWVEYLTGMGMECSVDLITGIPTQTPEEARQDSDAAVGLSVPHISLYRLTAEAGTPYRKRLPAAFRHPKPEVLDSMDEAESAAVQRLLSAGYGWYEVSNFAKTGHESRHNCVYWDLGNYAAAGEGAVGMLAGTFSPDQLAEFRQRGWWDGRRRVCALRYRCLPGCRFEVEIIDEAAYLLETVMMGLRLQRGIADSKMESRFHTSFRERFPAAVQRAEAAGWAAPTKGGFALNETGRLFLNSFLLTVMDEWEA